MTTSVQDIQAQIVALKQAQKAAKKDERIAARAAAKQDKMVQAEVLYKEFIAKLESKGVAEKDFRRYVKGLRNEAVTSE